MKDKAGFDNRNDGDFKSRELGQTELNEFDIHWNTAIIPRVSRLADILRCKINTQPRNDAFKWQLFASHPNKYWHWSQIVVYTIVVFPISTHVMKETIKSIVLVGIVHKLGIRHCWYSFFVCETIYPVEYYSARYSSYWKAIAHWNS